MKALAGLLVFVILPICYVLFVGTYFSRKRRAFQKEQPGKPYDTEALKKQISPAVWLGWKVWIAVLAFITIALRIWSIWNGT